MTKYEYLLMHLHYYFKNLYNCIIQMGFLPWGIWVAFPRESQLGHSHATQRTVPAGCFSVSIIHQTLTWTTVSKLVGILSQVNHKGLHHG